MRVSSAADHLAEDLAWGSSRTTRTGKHDGGFDGEGIVSRLGLVMGFPEGGSGGMIAQSMARRQRNSERRAAAAAAR